MTLPSYHFIQFLLIASGSSTTGNSGSVDASTPDVVANSQSGAIAVSTGTSAKGSTGSISLTTGLATGGINTCSNRRQCCKSQTFVEAKKKDTI